MVYISLSSDSGIEPVFSHYYDRTILTFEGQKKERVEDYGYRVSKVKGKTVDELSVLDHAQVLNVASLALTVLVLKLVMLVMMFL